jgi:flagellar biosynthetic protein FlhB
MSDTNDAASKTEEPTQRKLDQAREKGDVIRTMDLGSFALAGGGRGGRGAGRRLAVAQPGRQLTPFSRTRRTCTWTARRRRGRPLRGDGRRAGAAGRDAGRGASAGGRQAAADGPELTPDKLKPDFRSSRRQGLQRMFGADGLMQFVKSLVKVAMTGLIGWWILKPHCRSAPRSRR